MEIIFVLVLLGSITDVAFSIKSSCPPRPSLTHPSNDGIGNTGCGICDRLWDYYTDYASKCILKLSWEYYSSLPGRCKIVMGSGNREEILEFWQSANDMCVSAGGSRFEPQICECEPGIHLASYNSQFMQICGPHLDKQSLSERLYTCIQKEKDPEQLWLFYQDLKSECYSLTGQNITFPICGCDVCWKLLDETSDFMRTCGTYMDRREINQLMSTCEKIKCDPVELGCFKRNLEMICERKTNSTFEFPQCGCEECWLLFQTKSDFMKKCGSGMSDAMLRTLMKTCYTNMDDLDHFMAFVDNLEIVCYEKGNGYFEKEWCDCLDCLLLEDPTRDIWQDCIGYMSDSEKMEMRHNCLEDLENFTEDLLDDCYAKRGKNVALPECDSCRRDNLCIEVVVDYWPHVYTPKGSFDYCFNELDIGWNKSLVGYLIFADSTMNVVNLCTSYRNHKYDLSRRSGFNPRYFRGQNITKAMEQMAKNFNECNACENKHKYGIILTNGYNPTNFITNTVENIPKDITLIAVGNKRTHVDNLLIIARNIPDNVYDIEYFNIISAIDDDLKRRHRC